MTSRKARKTPYTPQEIRIINHETMNPTGKAILIDALRWPDAHTCHDIGARLKMNPQTIQKHVRAMRKDGILAELGLQDYGLIMQSPALAHTDAMPADPFLNPYEQVILMDIRLNAKREPGGSYSFLMNDIVERQGISISAVVKYLAGLRARGIMAAAHPEEPYRRATGRAYKLAV